MKADLPKQNDFLMWLEKHKTVEVKLAPENEKWKNLNFQDETYAKIDFDDKGWPTMKIPQRWEDTDIGEFDGIMWYRKSIAIPVQMAGKELTLSLGPIDDMDRTYFNGVLVGAGEESGLWQVDRNYTIPANLVKAGKNILVIRVLDTQGGGGIWGKPEKMKLTLKNDSMPQVEISSRNSINPRSISLAGDWKYMPFAELVGNKFYVFSDQEFFSNSRPMPTTAYTPTILYNGMVNPVTSYQIKGAIWYQGEANVGRADQYAKLLPLMIQDWRKSWNVGPFPFYYVQIAPYEYSDKDSTSSAALREAQAKAMQVANTGMAVTLDIGKVFNIHPPYKLEVGERLALWALAKDYNVQIPYSGPVYKSMIKEGNTIKLQFDFAQGGLVAKNGILKEFEIAGKDSKYVLAQAKIVNNEVVVSSSSVSEPLSVRYCWRNGAEASLFNGIGLPASVFRTK
jgi:sialate O-acetylesterase